MKLSISNIAWDQKEEFQVAKLIQQYTLRGLEIAPTKIWNTPTDVTEHAALFYRNGWNEKGIELVAMQSLLFGRPELTLFENDQKRNKTIEYLNQIFELARYLGVKSLVFGSPKNRLIGNQNKKECYKIAIDFFSILGERAQANDVVFCIEPNPSQYGCDFITTAKEGLQLVKDVNHPGFRFHLDTGAMILNNENFSDTIEESLPYLAHFHISEPYLELIGDNKKCHQEIAVILKTLAYENWISIEMKNGLMSSNLESVKSALDIVAEIYLK